MIEHSAEISKLLTEREELRKEARRMAVYVRNGHFNIIEQFYNRMEKRGGIIAPGVVLTLAVVAAGGNNTNLLFVGPEQEVLAQLQALNIKKQQPVPEGVAVKMLTLRLVKIAQGIEEHNKYERQREADAKLLLAQPNHPAWAAPYAPQLLPDLEQTDLPHCRRYLKHHAVAPGPNLHSWSFSGKGYHRAAENLEPA